MLTMADGSINFPNYFQIMFKKFENFIGELTEIEIAIILSVIFFVFILFISVMVVIFECLIRCRIKTIRKGKKLSAETYFKRSVKMSQGMSKINTPEFKHFEIELRRDSGRSSLTGSKESGMDSCFIEKCNMHNESYPKHEVDGISGGELV